MSQKSIMITGASGLLGSNAAFALQRDCRVIGTYLSHFIPIPRGKSVKLDIRDKVAVSELLKSERPDVVLHTAALVNVDECERDRALAYAMNVEATLNLARCAAELGSKLVFISTDAFFDGNKDSFTEEDEPTPMNYYGETKLAAEKGVQAICPDALIIRTNFYGWNFQDKQCLAEWMWQSLRDGKSIPAVRDVYYTPVHCARLVGVLAKLWSLDAKGVFNVAGSQRISKLEFAQLMCKIFGFEKKLLQETSVRDLSLFAARSSNMSLSIDKLEKFIPEMRLEMRKDAEADLVEFKEQWDHGFVKKLRS